MVRHSKELALDDYEFERFIRATYGIESYERQIEARFIGHVAGRLGLRLGEIVHFEGSWVNWRDSRIEIPRQQDCHKGRDRELCCLCHQQAKQRVESAQLTLPEARLEVLQERLSELPGLPGPIRRQLQTAHILHIDSDLGEEELDRQIDRLLEVAEPVDDAEAVQSALDRVARKHQDERELTLDEAKERMWMAKTDAAARSVPFGWCPAAEVSIEEFLEHFDGWEKSSSALRRRVDRTLELAVGLEIGDTTPHGLRATAASHLAGRGVSALTLKTMMGWVDASTAKVYLSDSPKRTARQLEQVNMR